MYKITTSSALELVQVSDTHLFSQPNGELLGINTRDSLEAVLSLLEQQPAPDILLMSGDVAQDHSAEAYHYLNQRLDSFNCAKFYFSGNHDEPELINQLGHKDRVIRSEHWQIILLNSQVYTKVHGHLSADQLELLEQNLTAAPHLHTLISFHHHPIPMGSSWIDPIGVDNAEEFLTLINAHDNVRCVLFGHVHQETDKVINGVRFLSSPSTCIQFLPLSVDFALDSLNPGYRWLKLQHDGQIDTAVVRTEINFTADMNSTGY